LQSAYEAYLIKKKYYEKTLTADALYMNWIRMLDIQPLFARIFWMNFLVFDLSQLGLGLLYYLLPIDIQPFLFDFKFVMPSMDELLQGIWAKFEQVKLEDMYPELANIEDYIRKNFQEEFQEDMIETLVMKGIYGVTQYSSSYFDPFIAREYMKSGTMRLRLQRMPESSWMSTMESVSQVLEIVGATDDHVFNRVMLHYSAQANAFILGLGVLGKSRLSTMDGDYAVIPFADSKGNMYNVKIRTLDHIQIGFILGLIPLGYGLLLPKTTIYKLPEGKKNPPIIDIVRKRITDIINRLPLTATAYANYNKPEEMADVHKSERTSQYDNLQTIRRQVEAWVEAKLPPQEANPVKTRQYKNAMLQAISWKAKRHKWGFKTFELMEEPKFKEWWLSNWQRQGLNQETLNKLYDEAQTWLSRLRENKTAIGEKVKQTRIKLASLYR
jgi:hypothetical protein